MLIQVAHVLNYCRSLGLIAHQDLKPENVLFKRMNLSPEIDPHVVAGYQTNIYVSDFGIADAFRNIGQNTGSRPYMAPEQFSQEMIVDGSKIDVFASRGNCIRMLHRRDASDWRTNDGCIARRHPRKTRGVGKTGHLAEVGRI